MNRIIPFLFLFVTGLAPSWAQQESFGWRHRVLSGLDLQWSQFAPLPWGQAASLNADLTSYLTTPWNWGLGLGLLSGLSTPGYSGTAFIYRSTVHFGAAPQFLWDWEPTADTSWRFAAGPVFSTWLFQREKSFTYAQGIRAESQVSILDTTTGRRMIFGLPVSLHWLQDGTTAFSLGLRAGFPAWTGGQR